MKRTRFVPQLAFSLTFVAILAIAALPVAGQSSDYKAPRTSWGVPDLEGVYLTTSSVPFQRPKDLGSKEFYTPAEVAELEAARAARGPADVGVHYDNAQYGLTSASSGTVPNLRTSLITGPTGQVPALLPAAVERQAADRAARRGHEYDGPENRGIAERCIYWGNEGPPMRPVGYNGNLQISQSDGYVAIMQEMIHDVRIIPTDGRAHLDPSVRQYFGDSVGHWEGDTLVVDTTNFNDIPPLGQGASRNLHVVERFTRTGEDTILYQWTVSDPSTWEESWSAEFPLGRTDGLVYEYACQEGNYGMAGILSGARVSELQEAAK